MQGSMDAWSQTLTISYPGPTATYNMSKRHDDETEYTGVKDPRTMGPKRELSDGGVGRNGAP